MAPTAAVREAPLPTRRLAPMHGGGPHGGPMVQPLPVDSIIRRPAPVEAVSARQTAIKAGARAWSGAMASGPVRHRIPAAAELSVPVRPLLAERPLPHVAVRARPSPENRPPA